MAKNPFVDETRNQFRDQIADLSNNYTTYPGVVFNSSKANTVSSDTQSNGIDILGNLGKKSSSEIDTQLVQTYQSIPGTIVKTLIEFPEYNSAGDSVVIELDDVMTLSYSVYRAKMPVVTLGQTSVGGYALGVKTVAGSMIRSVFTTDNLTQFQSKCYIANSEQIKKRMAHINGTVPSGVPEKEMWSFMKDDLATFNIHTVVLSENQVNAYETDEQSSTLFTRFESILGCVIMNNGQVYSIEDLITESTFSFQAKSVKSSSDITEFTIGYSNGGSAPSASSLLLKDGI